MLSNSRAHHGGRFHLHPLQGLFPLMASIILAILLMLVLIPQVK